MSRVHGEEPKRALCLSNHSSYEQVNDYISCAAKHLPKETILHSSRGIPFYCPTEPNEFPDRKLNSVKGYDLECYGCKIGLNILRQKNS